VLCLLAVIYMIVSLYEHFVTDNIINLNKDWKNFC